MGVQENINLPELGLGASAMGNLYQEISFEQCVATFEEAWSQGIRYYDTAPYYGLGLSEQRLGTILKGYPRSKYLLSTKVGKRLIDAEPVKERYGFINPAPADFIFDYSYDGIMRSVDSSLERLGVTYIDLLLVHDIGRDTHGEHHDLYFNQLRDDGYRALDKLKAEGTTRAIGLGVNEIEVCQLVLDYADWDHFLLAGRYTLLEQGGLTDFLPRCQQRGTSLIAAGIYNSGILATGVNGPSIPYYDYEPASTDIIGRVRKIEEVCATHSVAMTAAAIQFPLFHPAVSSVLPGTGKPERIKKIMEQLMLEIPVSFWQQLQEEGLVNIAAPISNE